MQPLSWFWTQTARPSVPPSTSGSPWTSYWPGHKAYLDIFWLRDESLEDPDNLPAPEVIAAEVVEDLQTALDEFTAIASSLSATKASS